MAFSIRQLKIRDQVFLVSLPPLFVLLCAIALFLYSYWVELASNRSSLRSEDTIARVGAVLGHLSEMQDGVRGYLVTRHATELVPYQRGLAALQNDLNALLELESEDAEHLARIESIRAQIDRWHEAWVTPTIMRVRRGETLDVPATIAEGQGRLDSLRKELSVLLEEERERDLARRRAAEQLIRGMSFLELGITVLMAGALIFLNWSVTRFIAAPIHQLIQASDRVSQGDLRPELPPSAPNEFGALSRSFSRMVTALREERGEMAALNKFSEAVTQCTTQEEVYQLLLQTLRERFQPRQVIIFSLHEPEKYLEAVKTLVPLPEKVRSSPIIEDPQNCKAVRSSRPFLVSDVTAEPVCPAKFAQPTEGSYYCRPLTASTNVIGAVRLEGLEDSWTRERESLLESYLGSVAVTLSNLRLLKTKQQQADVDMLTGLHNRRYFEDYARKQIGMGRRRNSLGFIAIDLDRFKSYNDDFGHEIGDRVLQYFSKAVTKVIRDSNVTARVGGEEFFVLLHDAHAKTCMLVAERIRRAVSRMTVPSGTEKPLPQLTVSLGIAVYPDHGKTFEEVFSAADKALYKSKRDGRNRATLYSEQMEFAGL